MRTKRTKRTFCLAGILAAGVLTLSAHAAFVTFNYTQSDATSHFGAIAPFTLMGHDFLATPMPAASVFDPNQGTPAGFVGSIDAQAGLGNEPGEAVGLLFNGTVTAASTDGFLVDIPLLFVPAQAAAPNVNDYTWSIQFGDAPGTGVDATSSSLRFALWLSQDDVIDGTETATIFQRYTQLNHTFAAGQDTFTNTDTVTAPIKDAFNAAGRPLNFYWGWRDQGALNSGAVLVDEFTVGGLLNADEGTLRPIPEPSTTIFLCAGSFLLLGRVPGNEKGKRSLRS
jgi:hypothetical protein